MPGSVHLHHKAREKAERHGRFKRHVLPVPQENSMGQAVDLIQIKRFKFGNTDGHQAQLLEQAAACFVRFRDSQAERKRPDAQLITHQDDDFV